MFLDKNKIEWKPICVDNWTSYTHLVSIGEKKEIIIEVMENDEVDNCFKGVIYGTNINTLTSEEFETFDECVDWVISVFNEKYGC